MVPLLIELLEDERDTGIASWYSSRIPPDTKTVGTLAVEALGELVARFRRTTTRQEAAEWWSANRGKPERDWHLADLSHKDDWVRAVAARNLAELKDEAAIPRMLDILPSLKDGYVFALAVRGFSVFPAGVRARALKPHLGDGRFDARWAVAELLLEPCRREAIDAMIEAFEIPPRLVEPSSWPWDFLKVFKWLAATGDASASDALFRFAGGGSGKRRVAALLALRGVGDPRAEERLSEAASDPTTDWDAYGPEIEVMKAPRACDAAALVLSERMKITAEYEWTESIRLRNRNVEAIVNRWRRSKGLPPVDYHGPGIVAVPVDKVKGLVPDLLSGEAAIREAAVVKLSELGPGAWRTLLAEGEGMTPASREVLEASARRAANCLRSVIIENREAEFFGPALRTRMHRPIDVDDLALLIGRAWFDRPDAGKLRCVLSRGADGIGFSVRLALDDPGRSERPAAGVMFEGNSMYTWDRLRGEAHFLTMFRRALEPIRTVLDLPDLQVELDFTVKRTF